MPRGTTRFASTCRSSIRGRRQRRWARSRGVPHLPGHAAQPSPAVLGVRQRPARGGDHPRAPAGILRRARHAVREALRPRRAHAVARRQLRSLHARSTSLNRSSPNRRTKMVRMLAEVDGRRTWIDMRRMGADGGRYFPEVGREIVATGADYGGPRGPTPTACVFDAGAGRLRRGLVRRRPRQLTVRIVQGSPGRTAATPRRKATTPDLRAYSAL